MYWSLILVEKMTEVLQKIVTIAITLRGCRDENSYVVLPARRS